PRTVPALTFTTPEAAGATGGLTVSPGDQIDVTVGAQNITSQHEHVTATARASDGVTVTRPAAFDVAGEGTGTTTASVTAPTKGGTYTVTFELSANGTALAPTTLKLLVLTPGELSPFFNNTGVSDDDNQRAANLDGLTNSYSAQALAAAGI